MQVDKTEIQDYIVRMFENEDSLKTDNDVSREFIRENVSRIPNGRLYKFRTCSNYNFNSLKEQKIWASLAKDFRDPLDSQVKIDFNKSADSIQEWSETTMPKIAEEAFSREAAELNRAYVLSDEETIQHCKSCFDEEGNFLPRQTKEFIEKVYEGEEREKALAYLDELERKSEDAPEEVAEKAFAEWVGTIQEVFRKTTKIFCLSETYENAALWENYADNYEGFCVEYCFDGWKDMDYSVARHVFNLFPVFYLDENGIDITFLVDGFMRTRFLQDDSWKRNYRALSEMSMQILYKTQPYSYEREWRLVLGGEKDNLVSFPFASAIYAGKDIKERNLQRLRNIAKQLGIPIYKQYVKKPKGTFEYRLVEENAK